MEKEAFLNILRHFTNITSSDVQKVLSLRDKYPYCQTLQVLAAKIAQDHQLQGNKQFLQLAAVYVADRTALKEIMAKTSLQEGDVIPAETDSSTVVFSPTIASAKVDEAPHDHAPATSEPVATSGDVADEVILDLQRLSELKHSFESMFMDSPATEAAIAPTEEGTLEHDTKKAAKKKSTDRKTKGQRIVELAQELQKSQTEGTGGTEILDEIKYSKKKIVPETEKLKEQLEIIDQFIKAQPSISNSKEKPPQVTQGDLATIKNGEFGDNVISETLVDILLKQGKKDKAIEVLKKLIWKFPQKKAYFAAQIEELKK